MRPMKLSLQTTFQLKCIPVNSLISLYRSEKRGHKIHDGPAMKDEPCLPPRSGYDCNITRAALRKRSFSSFWSTTMRNVEVKVKNILIPTAQSTLFKATLQENGILSLGQCQCMAPEMLNVSDLLANLPARALGRKARQEAYTLRRAHMQQHLPKIRSAAYLICASVYVSMCSLPSQAQSSKTTQRSNQSQRK